MLSLEFYGTQCPHGRSFHFDWLAAQFRPILNSAAQFGLFRSWDSMDAISPMGSASHPFGRSGRVVAYSELTLHQPLFATAEYCETAITVK
jgi:hypothetical protein